MIYRYPQEIHDFVKKWSPVLRDDDLAAECNKIFGTDFTANKMKSFRANHKYFNGQKQWTTEEYWKYQKRYPKGMYEFIRDNSWGVSSKEMAEMVNEKFGTNFTQTGMKQFRQRNRIRSGLTGWYQKGHPPGTKGKKQSEYMSPEAIERTKATRFKKGDRPLNELPVGTIKVNADGYKIIKVQDTGTQWERWAFLHRKVWQDHNGPIPDDMVIIFKDSNKLNCDISNLIMVTRDENSALNRKGWRSQDPQITETGLQTIRLKKAAKRRKSR